MRASLVGDNGKTDGTYLTLPAFDSCFRAWLLDDYHVRVHAQTEQAPKARWEAGGFLPRMPESLEQLDLLLLQEAKKRRGQQGGVRFPRHRHFYIHPPAHVGAEVLLSYDPRAPAV